MATPPKREVVWAWNFCTPEPLSMPQCQCALTHINRPAVNTEAASPVSGGIQYKGLKDIMGVNCKWH
jgi:hypothetical protein